LLGILLAVVGGALALTLSLVAAIATGVRGCCALLLRGRGRRAADGRGAEDGEAAL
jgi:hypothetical protein